MMMINYSINKKSRYQYYTVRRQRQLPNLPILASLLFVLIFCISPCSCNEEEAIQTPSICSICYNDTLSLSDIHHSIIPDQYRENIVYLFDTDRGVTCEEVVNDIILQQQQQQQQEDGQLSLEYCSILQESGFYEICGGCESVTITERILLSNASSTSTIGGLFTPTNTSSTTTTTTATPSASPLASITTTTSAPVLSSTVSSPTSDSSTDDDLVIILPSDTDNNTSTTGTGTGQGTGGQGPGTGMMPGGNTGKGNGTPCYVCGGDSTDTMSNGQNMQTLPTGQTQLSCAQILSDGQSGRIPTDHCCYFQNSLEFRTNCGCFSAVAKSLDGTTDPASCNVTTGVGNGSGGGGGGGMGGGGGGVGMGGGGGGGGGGMGGSGMGGGGMGGGSGMGGLGGGGGNGGMGGLGGGGGNGGMGGGGGGGNDGMGGGGGGGNGGMGGGGGAGMGGGGGSMGGGGGSMGGGGGGGGGGSTTGTASICYVCKNDPLATMTNPNATYPLPNGNATRACGVIQQDGLQQLIPSDDCSSYFQGSDEFYTTCGCTSVSSTATSDGSATKTDQSSTTTQSATSVASSYLFDWTRTVVMIVPFSAIFLF